MAPPVGLRSLRMSPPQLATLLAGLLLAAWSWAILNDWRGATQVWERMDARFPVVLQTPSAIAGPSLMVLGWAAALFPLVG